MDMMKLMKQAQQMQAKVAAMQAELEQAETEGQAGAGMVKVVMTGKGVLKAITIDPSMMKPEEKEILEDLLVAAHADARRKAEDVMQEKMKGLTGGLSLPPGLKLF